MLDSIVNVTITTAATAPTRVGFGTPLIMSYFPVSVFPERTRIYSSTAAMVTDGFAADHPAVLCATALFAQNPRVTQVIVGRMANAMTQDINFAPAQVLLNTDYVITINGTPFEFDSGGAPTATTIMTGLHGLINAGGEPVTSTDNTGDIDVAADVAGTLFTYEIDAALLDSTDITPDAGVVADYVAIANENNDFYSVHPTSQGKAEVVLLAAQIETVVKLLVVSSQDTDIPKVGGGDLATTLQTANYARTALLYHRKAHQYAGAGWAGVLLPKDPGSATWKFKTIAGVDTTVLTDTEIANIEGKDCNHYTEVAGVSITQQGINSAAEFLDIVRGVDWLRARMQERIYAVLVNEDKVPYTDPGVASIEAEVRAQLEDGINAGLLAADPEPTVTVPLVSDIPFADRAARLLPDVEFAATLAGAIHEIEIAGVVTV